MTLHWIRSQSLHRWYAEHANLVREGDALLLTDDALVDLPAEPAVNNPIYALAAEVTLPVPAYVNCIDDAQWLKLVLNYSHQYTW